MDFVDFLSNINQHKTTELISPDLWPHRPVQICIQLTIRYGTACSIPARDECRRRQRVEEPIIVHSKF